MNLNYPSITAKTSLNAVIGNPIEHSLSPLLHNSAYRDLRLDVVMLAFAHEKIEPLVDAIRSLQIGLTAVTMPHKQAITPFLDVIDPVAKEIQAVNTVIQRDGKLHGYNTDVVGIERALEKIDLGNKQVLILGAGGAARPAAFVCRLKKAKLFCLNRTFENAQELMAEFTGTAVTLKDLSNLKVDIIINTTPLGMSPNIEDTPFAQDFLQPGQVVFDIVYNPLETRLLRDAKTAGGHTISGLTMFIAQGLEQIRLWSGETVQSDKYFQLIYNHLSNS